MRRKLIAVILTFAMVLSPLNMFTLPANAATNKPDVLRSIFGNLDEVAPEEKRRSGTLCLRMETLDQAQRRETYGN